MSDTDLMTTAEVANHLKISAETVRDWWREGRIPGHRYSHKVLRFRLGEVVAALEAARPRDGRRRRAARAPRRRAPRSAPDGNPAPGTRRGRPSWTAKPPGWCRRKTSTPGRRRPPLRPSPKRKQPQRDHRRGCLVIRVTRPSGAPPQLVIRGGSKIPCQTILRHHPPTVNPGRGRPGSPPRGPRPTATSRPSGGSAATTTVPSAAAPTTTAAAGGTDASGSSPAMARSPTAPATSAPAASP